MIKNPSQLFLTLCLRQENKKEFSVIVEGLTSSHPSMKIVPRSINSLSKSNSNSKLWSTLTMSLFQLPLKKRKRPKLERIASRIIFRTSGVLLL